MSVTDTTSLHLVQQPLPCASVVTWGAARYESSKDNLLKSAVHGSRTLSRGCTRASCKRDMYDGGIREGVQHELRCVWPHVSNRNPIADLNDGGIWEGVQHKSYSDFFFFETNRITTFPIPCCSMQLSHQDIHLSPRWWWLLCYG